MVIREASSHSDLDEVVRIQREVWGASDLDIAGRIQLKATQHAGGSVLVACDDGGEIGGFAYAFPAHDKRGAFWHSDMLAVRPGFRGQGIGQALKWAQREHALARGITRVTWTFDPMQAGNAHLNLELLGVTVSEYLRNFYGVTSSALHHGLPTDRLLALWDLEAPRVRALARGQPTPHPSDCERCAIPRSWNDLVKNDPSEALDEQSRVAAELEAAFDRGLSILGFDKLSSSYLLGRGEGQ
jgi:predicted GNAT superfamily acetyltransferase